MSNEVRPEDGSRRTPRGCGAWVFAPKLVLVSLLSLLARRPAQEAVGPQQQQEIGEETDLLSSPWFWRGLWLLIGALMLLLFVYEFTVLS